MLLERGSRRRRGRGRHLRLLPPRPAGRAARAFGSRDGFDGMAYQQLRERCAAAGVPVVRGTKAEIIAKLRALGLDESELVDSPPASSPPPRREPFATARPPPVIREQRPIQGQLRAARARARRRAWTPFMREFRFVLALLSVPAFFALGIPSEDLEAAWARYFG